MSSINQANRDPNSVVTVGMPISGRITKKLKDFVVVVFDVGGNHCSGVLHVSEFPSLSREERDAMFGVVVVGMPANGVVVTEVTPPAEGQHFTKVRLSAKKPLLDAQPKPTPTPNQNKARPQGAPRSKGKKGAAAKSNGAGNHSGNGAGGGSKDDPAPAAATAKAKAKKSPPAAVAVAPVDHVAEARSLIANVRQPQDLGTFANLGIAMALKVAVTDVGFMARIATMEGCVADVERCASERKAIVDGTDSTALAAASKVHAARVQRAALDVEAATLRQKSALYAGLCKKVKGEPDNEALKAEQAAAKSEIDSRREKLAAGRTANDAAYNDGELELMLGSKCGPTGEEEFEALVAKAAQLAKLTTESDEKTVSLRKMVLRTRRHLEAQG